MAVKLVIDGNAVYEMDEECLECKKHHIEYEYKEERKMLKRTETPLEQRKMTPKKDVC